MVDEHAVDDQSHYEISLTAGQAFVAFVLLLLSLAAAFAFGLMLGRGQADERLVVRKETPVVTEASAMPNRKAAGEIVELGVAADDFEEPATETAAGDTAAATETTATAAVIEEVAATASAAPASAEPAAPAATHAAPAATPQVEKPAAPSAAPAVPHIAQLLSTGDQKIAEALAVKLINRGFTAAYVERGATDKGPIFRVRVRFPSEAEARAAEPKLREFSKDVWITAR